MLIEGKVKGIKNDAQEVELTFRIERTEEGRHTLSLVEGGVTGYESFYIEGRTGLLDFGLFDDDREPFYWCAGGMGYPSLHSNLEDIRAIIQAFLKLKQIVED
jgi:hypothetical protein